MKKVLLSAAVVAVSLMGFTSCINRIVDAIVEDHCWEIESVVVLESGTKTVSHFYWGTPVTVSVEADADIKDEFGEDADVQSKAIDVSDKYKTQEDCEAANK